MPCPSCEDLPLLFTSQNGLERWGQIKDYPNNWISTFGRLYNSYTRQVRTPTYTDMHGYVRVKLGKKKKTFNLHRLMGVVFLNVQSSEIHVHHIDKNRLNNLLCNLQVVTKEEHKLLHKEDGNRNPGLRKSPCFIKHLDTNEEHFFPSLTDAARFIGGSRKGLNRMVNSKGKYKHFKRWTIRIVQKGDLLIPPVASPDINIAND